jgi:hypothetical protein
VALASAAIGFVFLHEPDRADLDVQQGSLPSDGAASPPDRVSRR